MTMIMIDKAHEMRVMENKIRNEARNSARCVVPPDATIVATNVSFHSSNPVFMTVVSDIWWDLRDKHYITTFTADCDISLGVISDEYIIETKRRGEMSEREQ